MKSGKCPNCGFVETYVDDAKAKAHVAKKWPLALSSSNLHRDQQRRGDD
jgi:hypothetical protein